MPINFPEPIAPRYAPPLTYPSNLIADGRNYCTTLRFKRYQPSYDAIGTVVSGFNSALGGTLGLLDLENPFEIPNDPFNATLGDASPNVITLPIPKKVNEMNMMNWSEISLMGTLISAASGFYVGLAGEGAATPGEARAQQQAAQNTLDTITAGIGVASSFTGLQLNPYIMQYFQRPSLREFNFTWTLAPRNEKESEEVNKIIYEIKAAQAPRGSKLGILMDYPDLLKIDFYPKDRFQIELKECIIIGFNVDYTPAGPSYFSDSQGYSTAAPTLVNITMHLRETKLWWSQEWRDKKFTTPPVGDGRMDPRTAARAGSPEVTS